MIAVFSWLLTLFGCGGTEPGSKQLDPEATVVRETIVHGFDTDADPIISQMSDGSVRIQFEAMPPYFVEDTGIEFDMEDFRSGLQSVAGAPVVHDDREVFIVPNPTADTVDAVRTWLEAYPKPDGG